MTSQALHAFLVFAVVFVLFSGWTHGFLLHLFLKSSSVVFLMYFTGYSSPLVFHMLSAVSLSFFIVFPLTSHAPTLFSFKFHFLCPWHRVLGQKPTSSKFLQNAVSSVSSSLCFFLSLLLGCKWFQSSVSVLLCCLVYHISVLSNRD
jgi:hypothetical protein